MLLAASHGLHRAVEVLTDWVDTDVHVATPIERKNVAHVVLEEGYALMLAHGAEVGVYFEK